MSLTLPDWFWVSARAGLSEYPHQAPAEEENCVWRNWVSVCILDLRKSLAEEQCVHIVAWVTWYNTGLSPGQINTALGNHRVISLSKQARPLACSNMWCIKILLSNLFLPYAALLRLSRCGRLGWMISNIRREMCKYDSVQIVKYHIIIISLEFSWDREKIENI